MLLHNPAVRSHCLSLSPGELLTLIPFPPPHTKKEKKTTRTTGFTRPFTLRLLEMLCRETVRPWVTTSCCAYRSYGNAKRSAMAAKNISMQMMKFWYPAATVPAVCSTCPSSEKSGLITPACSSMASNNPRGSRNKTRYITMSVAHNGVFTLNGTGTGTETGNKSVV